jgi:DNA-binding PadR family transcriptional regulator
MNVNYLERKKRTGKSEEQIDISISILFILKEINEIPLYPYAIRRVILKKYNIDIPIQSIYTTIKKYEKLNYIVIDHVDDNKKYYTLTESGQKFLSNKSSYSELLVKKLCEV